ncbi:MAG: hypothetical protein K1X53_13860 [Candidatus Sumerlaeaceae bacterium]|nr:hypothetical protein [Candidatus Sumerlaeaceae bacterium]
MSCRQKMFSRKMGVVAVAVLCMGLGAANAQETSGMPALKEAPKGQESAGVMSGDKPFFLTTDQDGVVNYGFNEQNELDTIAAKKGVIFSSDDMTINADQLDYSNSKSEVVATGKRVVVRQGEVIATCQFFKYGADAQRSELSGDPVLYNRTKDGKVTKTAGDKIIIFKTNGRPQVQVLGGSKAPMLNGGKVDVPSPSSNPIPAPSDGGSARMTSEEPRPGAGAGSRGMMSGASRAPKQDSAAPSDSSSDSATPQSGSLLGVSGKEVKKLEGKQ